MLLLQQQLGRESTPFRTLPLERAWYHHLPHRRVWLLDPAEHSRRRRIHRLIRQCRRLSKSISTDHWCRRPWAMSSREARPGNNSRRISSSSSSLLVVAECRRMPRLFLRPCLRRMVRIQRLRLRRSILMADLMANTTPKTRNSHLL